MSERSGQVTGLFRSLPILSLALICAACTSVLPRYGLPSGATPTGFYEDRSRPDLALLEYRIAAYFAQARRPYASVCVTAQRIAPSDPDSKIVPLDPAIERRLLARFPELTPSGSCKRVGRSIVDETTGERAALFDVHDLDCESQTRCTAWGGYYADGPHGWSWYSLDWNGSAWTIRRRELEITPT